MNVLMGYLNVNLLFLFLTNLNLFNMTIQRLNKLGFQNKPQFGTRVETKKGNLGIINFCSVNIDLCRVYYDVDKKTQKLLFEMCKISECRILSVEEAVKL